MTDTIKMIDDALNAVKNGHIDNFDPNYDHLDVLEAALKVLQRIASGDDWFPIESAPRDGTAILARCFDKGVKMNTQRIIMWAEYREKWVFPDFCVTFNDRPSHWKPLDQAKHIEMLMEMEMKK